MFTTVHPVGQFPVPRVIVASVPRAEGHLKVPVAATPFTQSPIIVAVVGHEVMCISISFNFEQFWNMYRICWVEDGVVVSPMTGAFSKLEHP